MSRRLPPGLRDGQYRNWEVAMTTRYPLVLSEMRWPSAPLDTFETEALARWGIEIHAGWRAIMERLLERLEAEIARQPPAQRNGRSGHRGEWTERSISAIDAPRPAA